MNRVPFSDPELARPRSQRFMFQLSSTKGHCAFDPAGQIARLHTSGPVYLRLALVLSIWIDIRRVLGGYRPSDGSLFALR